LISDRDIYRTANLMIHKHGSEAHLQATMRAHQLLDKGDLDGQRTWLRIIKAIEDLTSTDQGDAPLN
jgi:hypothetical protein